MGIGEQTELILIVAGLVVVLFVFFAGLAVGFLLGKRSGRKNIHQ